MDIDVGMPAYTIDYYMAFLFPWLDWDLYEYVGEEYVSNEVAVHILSVSISDVGKAALTLDEFFQSELPPFKPEAKCETLASELEGGDWKIEEPSISEDDEDSDR